MFTYITVGTNDLERAIRFYDAVFATLGIERRVTVENVEAVVLEDSSLRSTLIGMTFLGRLKSYKVENGRLVLTQ